LLARVLDFCSPTACGKLGMSCRQARALAEDDMTYYRVFEELLHRPWTTCVVCHVPMARRSDGTCVLCDNVGTCRDCEFHIQALPHGVQDLDEEEPEGLRVGDIVCLQCGWHPSCNARQSRHYFRFVCACMLIDERREQRFAVERAEQGWAEQG
jgi:hypothetical protein